MGHPKAAKLPASDDGESRRSFDTANDDDTALSSSPSRRFILCVLFLGVILFSLSGTSDFRGCWARVALPARDMHPRSTPGRIELPAARDVIQAHAVDVVRRQAPTTTSSAGAPARTVLECFQVAQPVLLPQGATTSDGKVLAGTGKPEIKSCTAVLMEHVFAFSYGAPFVANYTPPVGCDFNRVVLNFTAVSQGRQYDRLALMYLGDTEVWRTSTAQPTQPPGIRWVYLKDMTHYLSLWKQPQKLIFDLGNLINEKYTGSFNTTLTATFFQDDVETTTTLPPSDLIIPISARRSASNEPSLFTLPEQNATNTIAFPRNANRAVFTISANGQSTEEFWWSNVLQTDTLTFNKTVGELYGLSPFREVQLFIDNNLVGASWPFPVVFTGGVVPGLHRPIVGIEAFDLREHEVDITAWLPYLSDGKQHTFTMRVAGIVDDGKSSGLVTETVGASWYVSGKIFLWLDSPDSITTGTVPLGDFLQPYIALSRSVTQDATGTNKTLDFALSVHRLIAGNAIVTTEKYNETVYYGQSITYEMNATTSNYGFTQFNDLTYKGRQSANAGDAFHYESWFSNPLWCNTTFAQTTDGNLTIQGRLRQGQDLSIFGKAVFPGGLEAFAHKRPSLGYYKISTTRDSTASYFSTGNGANSSGFGSTSQQFSYRAAPSNQGGRSIELYHRNVSAVNNTIVSNEETVEGQVVDESRGTVHPAGLVNQAPARGGGGMSPHARLIRALG